QFKIYFFKFTCFFIFFLTHIRKYFFFKFFNYLTMYTRFFRFFSTHILFVIKILNLYYIIIKLKNLMSKSFVGKNSNIVTNIIESSSNDLILKSKNTNLYDVVINDEIRIDEIKNNKKDKVLISNLRTNILKFGTD